MKRKNLMQIFALLLAIGFVAAFAIQVNSQTADISGLSLTEMTNLKNRTSDSTREAYTGQQSVQALMEAFDAIYNRDHLKTTVIVSHNAGGGTFSTSILTTGEVNLPDKINSIKGKRYVSQFTTAEIDARYPRATWLQMLLNKGVTIDSFSQYASYLSKRHTLAFLEDNPNLRKARLLGIPLTDDWQTYKTAYINKLVNDQAQIRKAAERAEHAKHLAESAKAHVEHAKHLAESAKAHVEHAKHLTERAKARAEHAKHLTERAKAHAEHIKAQIEKTKAEHERIKVKFERAKMLKPSINKIKWNRIKKSPYPAL